MKPRQWRLSPELEDTLRRAGERGDIIKSMHRRLRVAGLDAGASEISIYDPGDPGAPTVTGRIIDRGLHDELNDGHYVTVDAADGRVYYVALDPRQDMEDLPLGAVVEVEPAATALRPSDRTIAEIARNTEGLYSPDARHETDPRASAEFVQAYVRRLEALRHQDVVRRFPDGSWEIPEDFEDRVEALAKKPTPLRGERFGAAASDALHQRQDHLIEQGLAERDGRTVRYQRNLLRLLRRRALARRQAH